MESIPCSRLSRAHPVHFPWRLSAAFPTLSSGGNGLLAVLVDDLAMLIQLPAMKSRQSNRRTAVRRPCSLSVRFQVVGFHTDISRPAVSRDLSTTGIGMLTKAPIRPGTCLRIYLNATTRDTGVARAVIVRHYTREGPDRWLIGCSFSQELSPAELDALVR